MNAAGTFLSDSPRARRSMAASSARAASRRRPAAPLAAAASASAAALSRACRNETTLSNCTVKRTSTQALANLHHT